MLTGNKHKQEKPIQLCLLPSEFMRMFVLTGVTTGNFTVLQVLLQSGVGVSALMALRVVAIDAEQWTASVRARRGKAARTILG